MGFFAHSRLPVRECVCSAGINVRPSAAECVVLCRNRPSLLLPLTCRWEGKGEFGYGSRSWQPARVRYQSPLLSPFTCRRIRHQPAQP